MAMAATASLFETIALKAHSRFSSLPAYDSAIQLVPLDDHGGKRPAANFLPNLHSVPKTPDGLALVGAVYPTAGVGVRGRREVGAHFVLDIDKPGTHERIEREYGPLPMTYTTQTRPVSKPYKMHIYMSQTEHSYAMFKRQVTNVTSIAGYDVKCCGGWGHVAAEGSVRDGETITALYDVPIMPIPDSLVDWLCADIAKARALKHAGSVQDKKKTEPPTSKPEPPSRPFVVPYLDRTYTIKSRIRTWKNTGMTDDEIMPILTRHIRQYFENADQLLSRDGLRKIRAMLRVTPTLGARSYSNLNYHRRRRRYHKPKSPLAIMRERFKTCPAEITAADARVFFSVRTHADELRLHRQFKLHGYVAIGPRSHHCRWIRRPHPSLSFSSEDNSFDFSIPIDQESTRAQNTTP